MSQIYQEGKLRFITNLIRPSGESRVASKKIKKTCLEREQGNEADLGLFLVTGGARCSHTWLDLPISTKEGAPGLSCQFSQM